MSIFSIRKFKLAFLFYKKFLTISVLINLVIKFTGPSNQALFAGKIILIGGLYFYYRFLEKDDLLFFYKNFGITPEGLFFRTFLLDIAVTAITIFLIAIFEYAF